MGKFMNNEKILIVDDEADIALILKLQLEDAGYSTVRARDGLEAIDLLAREDFALILLDIKMPRMDGIQVLEKVQADHPDLAVIMMTAHGSEDIAVETMKKGALDYIAKPFSTEDLLNKVERTLELNRTRLENRRLQQQLDEERKKLEAILQGMADLLIAVDSEGTIITMNRKAELLLGGSSQEFRGMPVENVFKTDIPQNELPCKKVLSTLTPSLDVTYQLEAGQGKIPVLSSATPLFNAHGVLIGSVEIIRDISTLKALEQEKEDFVSMLTHDLKTPLTAVMGSIDLVREERLGKINAEQKDYLESAIESCSEVVEMINTLLDLYRFEANKMVMSFAREDPEMLIQRAMAGFRSLAERSRIKLTAHISERLPSIRVDRGKFVRLISNLLSNAFKFTPDRGEIDLTAELTDAASAAGSIPRICYPDAKLPEKGKYLKIQLKDTGIGIPPETLGTIFDKFVQGGTRPKLKNKGTGLGLTFCRKVMDAHGGYIWAESVPDQGSTFIVLFPLPTDK
jgi:PAS domain S-box-containing protein